MNLDILFNFLFKAQSGFLWIALTLGLFLVAIVFYFLVKKRLKEHDLSQDFKMSVFSIRMFKYEKSESGQSEAQAREIIAMMEQVYSAFLNLRAHSQLVGPARIVFEIASPWGGKTIEFFVIVPKSLETSLPKYIQGVYPQAVVEKLPQDYTVFTPEGYNQGGFLKFTKNDLLPLTTYANLSQDPLAQLTNALSKISEKEGAGIQVVLQPFDYSKFIEKGKKVISFLKKGKNLSEALALAEKSKFEEILFPNKGPSGEKKDEEPPVIDEHTLEAINLKIKKPLFEANIRIVASSPEELRAKEIFSQLESTFGQLAGYNSFETKKPKDKKLKKFFFNFVFRRFNPKERVILNVEELTSILHFPTPFLQTPNISWARTGAAPPPSDLPSQGEVLIGQVHYRGEKIPVYFASVNDRRRHFYIVGQTGTGKSSLLREMIRQDIAAGRGVGVIDPHGDLIEDTLANIPKERFDEVVLFEPFYMERPMGLNMLEYETPEQKDFAVQEMIAIFSKLFPPEFIGPMFEHYMRNAMLALMADKNNPRTLVEIPRMFTDPEFTQEVVEKVTDPLVRLFWLKEWKQTTGQTRSDMLGYVVSKVGRFIENEMMRNIIGQSHSSFNLAKIMDEGKIFLANLSKGMTGEVNSSLLGLILVSKMQMAAMKRASVPPEQRRDFYLYIDEFQNFTTDSIATILSEARKYRLNLILAHQYIPQLPDEIKNAVLGNVGSLGAFRIGADDAAFLESQFAPEFSKFDLSNLDNFNLIVKLMVNNKITTPFRMQTIPPKEGDYTQNELIKKISRLKYGRPKAEVEKEILERSKLGA